MPYHPLPNTAAQSDVPFVPWSFVETTQAVQDLDHTVPLIAGKRTVVRVYLRVHAALPVDVRGELTIESPNPYAPPPAVVRSINATTLNPASIGLRGLREDVTRSLNSILPDSHTESGHTRSDYRG